MIVKKIIVENKNVIKLFVSKILFVVFLILKFGRDFVASVAEECFYGKSCTFAASNKFSMITNAVYLSDYRIEVEFDNGFKRIIDLQNFLENSDNKLIRKFLKLSLFQQFHIEDGTLVWGDNEFDINPMNIEAGKYDARIRN